MARKQDTRTTTRRPAAKPRSAVKTTRARKSDAPAKTSAGKAPAKTGRKPRAASRAAVGMAALEAVRTPIAAAAEDTKSKVKSETKKALKAAKKAKKAAKFLPDLHMAHVPAQVTDAIKSVGGQIAGALNTDVGRVMVAELLMFMAKSLTKAASETETAKDAKSTLLIAGAKIGAAAADAGARMVDTSQAAVAGGARLVDQGRAAMSDGAGGAMSDARMLVKNVTDAAVGAVGGVVADAASRVIGTRRRKAPGNSPAEEEAAPPARKAGRQRRTPAPAADEASAGPSRKAGRPRRTPAADPAELAPPVDADAGRTPPAI